MKKTKVPTLFYLLPLTLLLMVSSTQSVARNQKRQDDLDAVRAKAWREGTVGIIVHMDVPSIRELSAASATFGGRDASPAIARNRSSADEALQGAIEYAAWRIRAEIAGTDYAVNAVYRYLPFIALRVSPNALALLETCPAVLGIEEDIPLKLIDPAQGSEGAKGDSSVIEDGGLRSMILDATVIIIGAKSAWKRGFTGAGWYVAVLDTGIRKTHEFFSEKDIVEACFAMGRDGLGGAGDCPNGSAIMTGSGAAEHHPSTYSGYDHGTHVTGIAAGNYGSLAGVAKDADIIVVQVFSKFTAGDCGSSSPCLQSWTSDILSGLNHVYSLRGDYEIAAVNLSLEGSKYYSPCDSDSTKSAIDLLRSAGIATVAATGNDASCNSITAPACVSTSVAVGSSTVDDDESSFNNWHPTMLKLFAPGTRVYSSTGASDSSYATRSNTSIASAHVAGAWALLKQAFPGGSVAELLDALKTKGKPVTSICDNYQTPIPRIQVDDAIAWLAPTYKLTIQTDGRGTTSPVPGTYDYDPGEEAQATAIPDAQNEFVAWTGDVSSTENPVTITMNGNKTIKANFGSKPKLTIQSGPNGTTSPGPGEYYYSQGSEVEVTAIPNIHCEFVDWSGDISAGENPVSVTVRADMTIKANFRPQPKLTIRSSPNGTTSPGPGEYYYSTGDQVVISAVPDPYSIFIGWTGSATGSDNPLSMTMNEDKTVSADFRFIFAPEASGRKVLNRTFSQAEYINVLTWQPDPANDGLDIAFYRIYIVSDDSRSLLAELGTDQREYYHRKAGQASLQYAVAAVLSDDTEGAPALVTIR